MLQRYEMFGRYRLTSPLNIVKAREFFIVRTRDRHQVRRLGHHRYHDATMPLPRRHYADTMQPSKKMRWLLSIGKRLFEYRQMGI